MSISGYDLKELGNPRHTVSSTPEGLPKQTANSWLRDITSPKLIYFSSKSIEYTSYVYIYVCTLIYI